RGVRANLQTFTTVHFRLPRRQRICDSDAAPAHLAMRMGRREVRMGVGGAMSERLLRGGAVLAVFLFLCVSWATYDPMQWPAPVPRRTLSSTSHPCGPLGLLAAHAGVRLFGRAASALVLGGLGMLGVGICAGWSRRRVLVLEARIVGLAAFVLAVAELAAGP